MAAGGSEPIRLRVLSYNVHHCEGVDGRLDLERIAGVIRSVDPDVVALQELDQFVPRSGTSDQPAELSRMTSLAFVFGPNLNYQGGQYGNAVLSRYPIAEHHNHSLPVIDEGEPRGVLDASVQVPGLFEPVRVLATHLDHRRDDRERLASVRFINDLVGEDARRPALLIGDLNDVIASPTLEALSLEWTVANDRPLPTIPVSEPTRQIDFVLFRPARGWQVIEARVLEEKTASDHRAFFVELEWRSAVD